MTNIFKNLEITEPPNFYDYCCDYIEQSHTGNGEMTANEKIYILCVSYIYGDITEKQKEILADFFKVS